MSLEKLILFLRNYKKYMFCKLLIFCIFFESFYLVILKWIFLRENVFFYVMEILVFFKYDVIIWIFFLLIEYYLFKEYIFFVFYFIIVYNFG